LNYFGDIPIILFLSVQKENPI